MVDSITVVFGADIKCYRFEKKVPLRHFKKCVTDVQRYAGVSNEKGEIMAQEAA